MKAANTKPNMEQAARFLEEGGYHEPSKAENSNTFSKLSSTVAITTNPEKPNKHTCEEKRSAFFQWKTGSEGLTMDKNT